MGRQSQWRNQGGCFGCVVPRLFNSVNICQFKINICVLCVLTLHNYYKHKRNDKSLYSKNDHDQNPFKILIKFSLNDNLPTHKEQMRFL